MVCTTQATCNAGEQISADSKTALRTCSACGADSYQSSTDHRTMVCTTQATCNAGEKISADSKTAARTCSACGTDSYQSSTAHRITVCTTQTTCSAGEQISADSKTAARTCSACGADTFQSATGNRLTSCTTQATCNAGEQISADSKTAVRTCSACGTDTYQTATGHRTTCRALFAPTVVGASGAVEITSTCALPSGSTVTTGIFKGSFDLGTGLLAGESNQYNGFMFSRNAAGNLSWAVSFPSSSSGTNGFFPRACSAAGNGTDAIFVGGFAKGTASLGSASISTGDATSRGVVANLNAFGVTEWATVFGSTDSDCEASAESLAVLQDGHVLVGGTTKCTMVATTNWNGAGSTQTLDLSATKGGQTGTTQQGIALAFSTTGVAVTGVNVGGTRSVPNAALVFGRTKVSSLIWYNTRHSLAHVAAFSNVTNQQHSVGIFDFGYYTGSNTVYMTLIQKWNGLPGVGSPKWTKGLYCRGGGTSGVNTKVINEVRATAVSTLKADDAVVVAGRQTCNWPSAGNPGLTVATTGSAEQKELTREMMAKHGCYVAKFNTVGVPAWLATFEIGMSGGVFYCSVSTIAEHTDGSILAGGYFTGTLTFNNGDTLVSAGDRDMFLVKLKSADGSLLWAKKYGGGGSDGMYGRNVATGTGAPITISARFKSSSITVDGTALSRVGSESGLLFEIDS
jgi:hypothetical protein